MTGKIVARRYAKALFALAAKAGGNAPAQYGADLEAFAAILVASPDLLRVFASPVIAEEAKRSVLAGLVGKLSLTPMAHHIPFLSALGIGSLMYKTGGRPNYVFISGGFAEVSGNKVTILAEVAERPEEIDVERAKKAQERAKKRLEREREKVDYTRAHVDDDKTFLLCKDISKRIEENLTYPGQIRVTVIREKRAVGFAK